jgi:hypothetical protein
MALISLSPFVTDSIATLLEFIALFIWVQKGYRPAVLTLDKHVIDSLAIFIEGQLLLFIMISIVIILIKHIFFCLGLMLAEYLLIIRPLQPLLSVVAYLLVFLCQSLLQLIDKS